MLFVILIYVHLSQGQNVMSNKELLQKKLELVQACPSQQEAQSLLELQIILEEKEDLKVIQNQLHNQLTNLQSFIKFIQLLEKDYKPNERGSGFEGSHTGSKKDLKFKKDQKFSQNQVYEILKEVLKDIRYAIDQLQHLEKMHKKLKFMEELLDLFNIAAQQVPNQIISQSKLNELQHCSQHLINDIYESELPGKNNNHNNNVKKTKDISEEDFSIPYSKNDKTKKLFHQRKLSKSAIKKKYSSALKQQQHNRKNRK